MKTNLKTLTLLFLLIASTLSGQVKWSGWNQNPCFKGIYWRTGLQKWVQGDYEWHIQFKSTYSSKVSISYGWNLEGSNFETDGKTHNRITIQPNSTIGSTGTERYTKRSSANSFVTVDKVCFGSWFECSNTGSSGPCFAQCDNGTPNIPTCGNTKNSSSNSANNQNSNSQNQNSNSTQANANDFQGLINELNSSCQKLGMVMNQNTGSNVYNNYCKNGKTYEPTQQNKYYLQRIIPDIKAETARFDKEFAAYEQQQQSQQDYYKAQQEAQRQQQEAQQRENERINNFNNAATRANNAENSHNHDEAIAAYEEVLANAGNEQERQQVQERIAKIKKNKRNLETIQTVRDALIPALQAIEDANKQKRAREKAENEKKHREWQAKEDARKEDAKESAKSINLSYLENDDMLAFLSFGQALLKDVNAAEKITKIIPSFTDTNKSVAIIYDNNDAGVRVDFYDNTKMNFFNKNIIFHTKTSNEAKLRNMIEKTGLASHTSYIYSDYKSTIFAITKFEDGSYKNLIPKKGMNEMKKLISNHIKKNSSEIKYDGSNKALLELGWQYYTGGNGEKQDKEKAVSYFRKCADKDDVDCMRALTFYYTQKGHKDTEGTVYNEQTIQSNENYKTAILWAEKAAALGSSDANSDLNHIYKNGFGVQKSFYKQNFYADEVNRIRREKCNLGDSENCRLLELIPHLYFGRNETLESKSDFGSKPQGRPVIVLFNLKENIANFSTEDNNSFTLSLDEPTILRASLKEEFKGKVNLKIKVLLANGKKKELKIKGEVTDFVPFKNFEH